MFPELLSIVVLCITGLGVAEKKKKCNNFAKKEWDVGRQVEDTKGLAIIANPMCLQSGAEGTRTLDLLRDRQAL